MAVQHCTIVQLSAHLDGELSPAARTKLESHLAGCPLCTAQLHDLRAVGVALRRRYEAQAEAHDFSGFAASVLSRLVPHTPSLAERLRVGWEEYRTHRPGLLWGAPVLAAAALVALLAVPTTPVPTNEAVAEGLHPALQAVSTDEQSHVAPVVLKTEGGDAIIWLVDHPDRPTLGLGTDASAPDVTPPSAPRPKGGEL